VISRVTGGEVSSTDGKLASRGRKALRKSTLNRVHPEVKILGKPIYALKGIVLWDLGLWDWA
jgi:hypothetical protein